MRGLIDEFAMLKIVVFIRGCRRLMSSRERVSHGG